MTAPDPPEPAGPDRPSPAPEAAARPHRGLAALLAIALAGFAYRALWLWDPATHELPPLEGWIFLASERPPQAVFALALLLLLLRRRAIAAALTHGPAPVAGAVGVGVALLLLAGSRAAGATELQLLSAIAFGFGAAALAAGGPLVRELAFPLALLLFAVPFPDTLYLTLVPWLEETTAAGTAALLGALGIPVVRDTQVLTLSDDVFMIIETCAGAGSIAILLLLTAFWIGATRAPWPRAWLLLAFAPLLAFGLNTLRVLALILTPGTVGAGLHALQGLILFQGGILGLWLADGALSRLLPGPPRGAVRTPEPAGPDRDDDEAQGTLRAPDTAEPVPRSAALGPLAAAALAAAVSVFWPPAAPDEPPGPWSMPLPRELLGAPGVQAEIDVKFLGSLRFGWMQHVRFGEGDRAVQVFVGAEDPARPPRSVRSPKNRVQGRAHRTLSVEPLPGRASRDGGEEVLASFESRRVLSHVLYAGHGPAWAEAAAGILGLRPPALATTPRSRVLRVTTPAGNSPGDLQQARKRLEEALAGLTPDFAAR